MDMVFVKENEAWEKREDESKICLTSVRTAKLIRSPCDDERVMSQEPGTRHQVTW